MTSGAAESNPTMSNIPGSLGSAIENPLLAIPQTTSLELMPENWGGTDRNVRIIGNIMLTFVALAQYRVGILAEF